MKKVRMLVFAIAVMVLLSACGQPKTVTDAENAKGVSEGGKTSEVVLDITEEPIEMDPILAYDAIGMSVLTHCISGIARLDKNDKPIPDLAEKWEINDDSTEYTIYLRKDAQWSNGEPVTAKDYYFAWTTRMKADTAAYMGSFLYENIKNGKSYYDGTGTAEDLGIQVLDDYTLNIQWERPMTDGLFLLALPMYGPVNQKSYEEIGAGQYGKDADKLVTNGAYRLTEWVHDDHITLEKSETYYNAANIQIPKVKLVMIGDPNARVNAFSAGEIDMANLYSDQIVRMKETAEKNIRTYVDGGSWYIGFNMENEFLKNQNLRKALSCSVDVQSLLDYVIADGSVAADGLVPGSIGGAGEKSYAEERGSLTGYDKDKAREYLELALAELGVSASQIKLSLDVADTTYSQNQAVYIQQQWKENLGLDVEIRVQAWKALQEAKANGDFAIGIEGNGPIENTAMTFLEYFLTENPNNLGKYSNSTFDNLLQQADLEDDPVKKQDLMIQAETILIDEGVVGPLYFTCTTYVVSDRLEGVVRTPFQYFNLCDGASIKSE